MGNTKISTAGRDIPDYRRTIISCYLGYITQAAVNTLSPLLFLIFREQFGFSLTQITFITTLNFAVQLTVDLLSAGFVDKIGYRICTVAAHWFCAAGLVGISLFPRLFPDSYIGLIVAVVLYAIGGGLTEVLISPIVDACPSEHKAKAMSLLHSFYCWGTVAVVVISTLFLYVFGKQNWTWLPILWAILPVYNAFRFQRVPIAPINDGAEGMKIPALLKSGLFWLMFLLMFASGASEHSMSQWASAFAESGLHVSKTAGDLAGPCFFSVQMGISRTFYGKKGEKINLLVYIIISAAVCVAAFLLAALSSSPLLALLGCGLCGLGVGIMWPGVLSHSASSIPGGGTALFALLALAGDLGCSLGPTVVGLVSAAANDDLRKGFLAAIVFPLILIIGCLFLKKKRS